MEKHREYLCAIRDGIKTVVRAEIVVREDLRTFEHRRWYVQGSVHKKPGAWFMRWVAAEVAPLNMGPYASFSVARAQLEYTMQCHAENLRGGSYLKHTTFRAT